ncbi:MAG: hypothetical protein WBQ89_06760, partial [Candidatus Acidiferrum sp.]
ASSMFESRFDAYPIFLYEGPLCRVACHFVGAPVRIPTRVPKELDEKHELSRRCRDSGARMRAVLDSKSTIVTG